MVKVRLRIRHEYCGKVYGLYHLIPLFLIFFCLGFVISEIIYSNLLINVIFSSVSGAVGAYACISVRIGRRKREFKLEFCDFLDSLSSSFSCGRNSYDAIIFAEEEMRSLYGNDAPICFAAGKVVDGIKNGRDLGEALNEMAINSECEDAIIFADVYSICSEKGGNLKDIALDVKNVIVEKIAVEAEISTLLSEPKNELNIMSCMPLVISLSFKLFSTGVSTDNSFLISTITLVIFAFSYLLGRKIVAVKV